MHEFERLRYFQDRHRPVQLAYHGTDECGAQLRRVARGPRSARTHGPGIRAALRLPGADRPRPLHGPRHPPGLGRLESRHHRFFRRGTGSAQNSRGGPHPPVGPARDRLRRAAQSAVPHGPGAARAFQRHALHRARCGAAGIGARGVLQHRRRLRRAGRRRGQYRRRTPRASVRVQFGRAAARARPGSGLGDSRTDARPRTHLAQRCGNSHRPAANLAGHAGLRAPRLRGAGAVAGRARRAPARAEALPPAHERQIP